MSAPALAPVQGMRKGSAPVRYALIAFVLAALAGVAPANAELPSDPLHSTMWHDLAKRYFGTAQVVFDDQVKIVVPETVENQAQVPVTADARGLDGVQKMIVFADLNPIQHVLTLTPGKAAAYVSFRMKIEQATPVRAAALTADGVWHVGGLFLDATGGGCSLPAEARGEASWASSVGITQGRLWREIDGSARLRVRLRHPMDTGLAKDNTPAYYIEKLDVRSASGEQLGLLELFEPVSEDPTLTLLVHLPPSDGALTIEGRDNNGGVYRSTVSAAWKESAIEAATTPQP